MSAARWIERHGFAAEPSALSSPSVATKYSAAFALNAQAANAIASFLFFMAEIISKLRAPAQDTIGSLYLDVTVISDR